MSDNRAGRVENRQELQGNRQQRRDEVRNQVAENHPRMDFWSNNPGWAAWRITAPYRWATWGALGGWIGYGAGEPSSYAYGENIYYEGDQVYYGDQPVATADAVCPAGRCDRRQRAGNETRERRVAAAGRVRPHAGRRRLPA